MAAQCRWSPGAGECTPCVPACALAACVLIVQHGLWPSHNNAGVTLPCPCHPARPALPAVQHAGRALLRPLQHCVHHQRAGTHRAGRLVWPRGALNCIDEGFGLQAANRSLPFLLCIFACWTVERPSRLHVPDSLGQCRALPIQLLADVWSPACHASPHCVQENLGIAAEHGWFWRPNARSEWQVCCVWAVLMCIAAVAERSCVPRVALCLSCLQMPHGVPSLSCPSLPAFFAASEHGSFSAAALLPVWCRCKTPRSSLVGRTLLSRSCRWGVGVGATNTGSCMHQLLHQLPGTVSDRAVHQALWFSGRGTPLHLFA